MKWKCVSIYSTVQKVGTSHLYITIVVEMSIFIFLLLLFASLMCCTNAADNRNKEEIVYRQSQKSNEIPAFRKKRSSNYDGRETEQNPNDPKYTEMAKEIIYYHLRIKKGDARKIIVNKVTTQVVAGTKTKIQFKVVLNSGKTISCDSETWEQAWEKDKKITYKCNDSNGNPENGHNEEKEQNVQPKDVDKAKYLGLAEESVRNYIDNKLPGKHEIVEINTKNNAFTLTLVRQQLIMYVNLDVIVRDSSNLICSVVFAIPNTIPLNTKCTEKLNVPGGNQWADPSKRKYLDFANKSLLNAKGISLTLVQNRQDTIVTFVLRQVGSGFKDSIDFIVRPLRGDEYECQTRVWEKSNGQAVIEEVNCHLRKHEEEDAKPPINPDQPNKDENEFFKHAKESVRVYFEQKQLATVETNIKNNAYITTPVHQEKIMYINLDVIMRDSSNYICSVVFVLPNTVPLNTECIEKRNQPDGNHWADPSTYKYIGLAEKSLQIKQEQIFAMKHDTIITYVVQQVVSGLKYTIDFIVRLIDGNEYECHSHVLENLTGEIVIEEVTCYPRGANPPKPNDPNANIYTELGKAYIRINLPAQLQIIGTKIKNIAYVTPPVYNQQIIYLNYEVVVRNSNNYICTVVFVIPNRNSLSTKCIENSNTPAGIQWVDPSIKKYFDIALESLKQNVTLSQEIGTNSYDTIVTFVIQQIISGYKDTIDFIIRSIDGREYECHSLVWEKTTGQVATEGVTCQLRGSNPPTPTPTTTTKPNDIEPYIYKEIYSRLGIDFIKNYITQLPGILEVVDTKIRNMVIVKTLVHQQKILYINYDVVVRPSSNYICSILFEIPNYKSLSTKCIENNNTPGAIQWVDPSIHKYFDIALGSLKQNLTLFQEIGTTGYDTIITFVIQQIASGYKDTIDFIIRSIDGREYECHSVVWEKTTGLVVTEGVTCQLRGSNPPTPTPKPNEIEPSFSKEIYNRLGIDFIKYYITQLPGMLEIVDTKIRNIAIVKTPVHQQTILYINYDVVVRPSRKYICSVLFVIPSNNSLSTKCIEDQGAAGGLYWVDPSKKDYLDLAEQWLMVNNNGVGSHDIIITFVVQEVISGYKDTIDFIVLPEVGNEYECQSHVWETMTGSILEDGKCGTKLIPGGQGGQEFDYSEYIELGTSAVLIYMHNLPGKHEVVQTNIINIAIVTPPVNQQKILYMNFDLAIRGSGNYICSVLFELPSHNPLSTNCVENNNTPGGMQWVDPSKLKYFKLAVESISQDKILLNEIGTSRYDTIVTFVIQQVLSGYKYTINFIVRLIHGRQFECRSNVSETVIGQVIIEGVSCHPLGPNPPGPKPNDPNEQYIESGIKYIRIYLPTQLEITETKVINSTYVTLPNYQQQIIYINYEVVVRNSNNYICTVLFAIPSNISLSTKCIQNQNIPGGIQWVDPSKETYLGFAEESLAIIQRELANLGVTSYYPIVTFVFQQFVSGVKDTIEFIIRSSDGREYECRSNVWEKIPGQAIIEDISCKQRGQDRPQPQDPQVIYEGYYESGKASVQIFINNILPGNLEAAEVKILNIFNVTTPVRRQQILYIHYDVIVRGSKYICTVVFAMPNKNSIGTNCIENQAIPGGLYWVDPSKKEYLDLAEMSLLIRQENSMCVSSHDIIVTFVAQQVDSGLKDRIDFIVLPGYGREYQCRSNVWEKGIGQTIINDLNCQWNTKQRIEFGVQSQTKPLDPNEIRKVQDLQDIKWTNFNGLAKQFVKDYRLNKKHSYRHRG